MLNDFSYLAGSSSHLLFISYSPTHAPSTYQKVLSCLLI